MRAPGRRLRNGAFDGCVLCILLSFGPTCASQACRGRQRKPGLAKRLIVFPWCEEMRVFFKKRLSPDYGNMHG